MRTFTMKIPFPQANNLELIFNTLCIFPLQGTSISETDLLVDYLPRQKAYYFNALLFLGFLKKEAHQYVLSDCGLAIRKMENKTLQIARFIDVVLSDSEMADLYHNSGKIREVEQKMTFYAEYC